MNMPPPVTQQQPAPLGNRGRRVTGVSPKCAHCKHVMAPRLYPGTPKMFCSGVPDGRASQGKGADAAK
ncbi:MAG: hypothetical protein USCAAHI_01680 [Beijerinckiaceae bacterium]|jgi:hypothetical protein|nr:MAG: hypothetical protein USCAAHI_01680 [Beijerinckiaceae bacterium]